MKFLISPVRSSSMKSLANTANEKNVNVARRVQNKERPDKSRKKLLINQMGDASERTEGCDMATYGCA